MLAVLDEPSPAKDVADPLAVLRHRASAGTPARLRAWLARVPPDARPWALAFATLIVVVVVGAAVWMVWAGADRGAAVAAGTDPLAELPRAGTTMPDQPVATTSTAQLVVHAAGAVARPGLYRLPAGARVGELLDAAGGARPDADHDRVNLAAPLSDGARVYVPRTGELDVPAIVDVPDGATAAPPGTRASSTIDVNRASAEELEALPGVGPAVAAAIVEHRQRHGPFRSVDQLLDVRGIGEARLEQLRPLVRV